MKRFFAFGCSYTSYSWPTWANLLSSEYDEYHNWGLAGLGNRAISDRVTEANIRYNFTKDDVVIVQWSSHLRNDFYHPFSLPDRAAGWKTGGSIFNYLNASLYSEEWVDTFFFEPAYMMHTLNNISQIQNLLENIGCTWYMTSIGDIRNMGNDLREGKGYGEKPLLQPDKDTKFYWEAIPELLIYEDSIWKQRSSHWLMPLEQYCQTCQELTYDFVDTKVENQSFLDIHPSPAQHLGWIKQELADKLSISLETLELGAKITEAVDQLHNQMKFNKEVFNLAMAKIELPMLKNKGIIWPGSREGF